MHEWGSSLIKENASHTCWEHLSGFDTNFKGWHMFAFMQNIVWANLLGQHCIWVVGPTVRACRNRQYCLRQCFDSRWRSRFHCCHYRCSQACCAWTGGSALVRAYNILLHTSVPWSITNHWTTCNILSRTLHLSSEILCKIIYKVLNTICSNNQRPSTISQHINVK